MVGWWVLLWFVRGFSLARVVFRLAVRGGFLSALFQLVRVLGRRSAGARGAWVSFGE